MHDPHQIKSFSNVLILCTSNLSDAIDDAFVDRADVKQYIGNPVSCFLSFWFAFVVLIAGPAVFG